MRVELGNVVPGEPLQVNWRFTRFMDVKAPDWGLGWRGSITVRFFVEGQLVQERGGVLVTDQANGTGNQSDTIIVRDQNVARTVYRFGPKWLEVEILRSDKPGASSYRWGQYFWVNPEPIDASWWQWRVPPFQSVPWKEGYALAGDFLNNSRFATVATLSVEISEVRSEENPHINPCEHPSALPPETRKDIVGRGGRVPFSFGFLQDWSWLQGGVYVIYGPLRKTFAYAVWFQCTDEYGNVYKGVCSPGLTRLVEVSDAKRVAGVAAFAAAATALYLAAGAAAAAATLVGVVVAGALFAAASFAYGVAATAGGIAKDPPAPDPAFRDPVAVEPLPLPEWPAFDSPVPQSINSLRRMLETAAHLLALENARTITRARLMGSALFGDQEAQERQRQRYLEIEREMVETAAKLAQILPELERAMDSDPLFDPKKAAVWADAMVGTGLPSPMVRAMAEAELSPDQINELAVLATYEWLLELVKERRLSLVPLGESLQRFVQEVRGQREAVLAGETYVEVRSPRVTFSDRPRYCV